MFGFIGLLLHRSSGHRGNHWAEGNQFKTPVWGNQRCSDPVRSSCCCCDDSDDSPERRHTCLRGEGAGHQGDKEEDVRTLWCSSQLRFSYRKKETQKDENLWAEEKSFVNRFQRAAGPNRTWLIPAGIRLPLKSPRPRATQDQNQFSSVETFPWKTRRRNPPAGRAGESLRPEEQDGKPIRTTDTSGLSLQFSFISLGLFV